MKSLTRHQFEHIAYHYVGMAEFSGYHSTGGVWVYNHNYVNNAWKMWQEFQKLSDERLSDRESEIRAEYTYCTPPEQTIRTQQATIERLTAAIKVKDTALANVIVADRFCAETNASDEHRQAKADAHHEAILSVENALAIKPENVELVEVGEVEHELDHDGMSRGQFGSLAQSWIIPMYTKLYTIKHK